MVRAQESGSESRAVQELNEEIEEARQQLDELAAADEENWDDLREETYEDFMELEQEYRQVIPGENESHSL